MPAEEFLLQCRAKSKIPEGAKSVIVCLFPYYSPELEQGNISQYGKPEEIVKTPENDFVQEFILRQLEIKKNNIYSLFSVPRTERVPGMMQEVLVS